MSDATYNAFDALARLCGCPHWDYPGQVVRDVAAMKADLTERAEKAELALNEARRVARVLAKSLEHICHDHDLAMEVVGVMLKLGESAAAVLVDAQKTALAYPEAGGSDDI